MIFVYTDVRMFQVKENDSKEVPMYRMFVGNPYEHFQDGDTICITTNGEIKKDGRAVMGAGTALFARDTFGVDEQLGQYLKKYGNRSFYLGLFTFPKVQGFEKVEGKRLHLATFPTKNAWRNPSDPKLIEQSAIQIKQIADKFHLEKIYIPMPGGLHGKLVWSSIRPLLSSLDERFTIYTKHKEDFEK